MSRVVRNENGRANTFPALKRPSPTAHAHPAGVGGGHASTEESFPAIGGKVGNFIPFDLMARGRRVPAELQRFREPAHRGFVADDWNTSIVHLTWVFPFAGDGERGQRPANEPPVYMLRWLPASALVVADAGYVGYNVAATMILANVFFLIRMSSKATFTAETQERLESSRRDCQLLARTSR